MSSLPVDEEAIRTLARILTETGLTEIEVAAGDSRVRVARMPAPVAAAAPAMLAAAAPAAPAAAPALEDPAAHPGAVTSPMVGIAFLSPEPGSPPYVTQGQQVAAGQTLLLIEAMKTFNQIKAPRAGTVGRILVGSGSPVEYGEALMIVEA
ncbi:MAG: acetyl-CoA carboxylase biotin carboxyl carrier protein [Janthinobacterium lividum]